MKRSPLRRVTPLRAASTLKRVPIKRSTKLRRKYSDSMMRVRVRRKRQGLADPKYLAFIRKQPCCAPGCSRRTRIQAHHHSMRGAGTGRKAPDRDTMPLCPRCHVHGLHKLAGPFKGWTRAELGDWQDEQVACFQTLYRSQGGELVEPRAAA